MRESRKDLQTDEKSFFQEETILEHPFACTRRMEMLSQIKEAVQEGVNLILLTGEQGSGKTVLCRLLEKEMAASCTTVFFPQAVDSFEDVVLSAARQLGVEEAGGELENIDFAVEQVSDTLLGESRELLIILDEAENIFLASLEKIRRVLEQMIRSGVPVHILLSGRKTLLENCDQISLGDIPEIRERQFDLVPLSYDETADYLRNVAVWQSDIDVSEVLRDTVIEEIYAQARGNLGQTNTFAQDVLESPDEDSSFMVLLEGVRESVDSIGDHPVFMKYSGLVKKFPLYLPWAGVAVCFFLLLFFLFRPGGNENDIGGESNRTVEKEEVAVQEKEETLFFEKDEPETMAPAAAEQPPIEKETAEHKEGQANLSGQVAMVVASESVAPQQGDSQVQGVVEQIGLATETEAETGDVTDESAVMVEGVTAEEMTENEIVEVVEIKVQEAAQAGAGGDIVRLRRLDKVKKKEPRLPRAETGASQAPTTSTKAGQLYDARLHAGSGWFTGGKNGMYTVQLMALTSQNAENNLKKMLSQVAYRQESGNFYILRKVTIPEGIFVFYGEYPSPEMARLARDSLPKFLRDQKPYVLSIEGAVAKVTK